jgi:hypothetical protein
MKGFLLLLVLSGIACRDVSNLRTLAKALDQEFDDSKVSVSLASQILLTVTVEDSVLVVASCETQVGVAMRVARLLPQHYAQLGEMQVVNVSFAPPPDWGEVPLRYARLPIRFSPKAVTAGLQPQDSAKAVESCRAFEELNRP